MVFLVFYFSGCQTDFYFSGCQIDFYFSGCQNRPGSNEKRCINVLKLCSVLFRFLHFRVCLIHRWVASLGSDTESFSKSLLWSRQRTLPRPIPRSHAGSVHRDFPRNVRRSFRQGRRRSCHRRLPKGYAKRLLWRIAQGSVPGAHPWKCFLEAPIRAFAGAFL